LDLSEPPGLFLQRGEVGTTAVQKKKKTQRLTGFFSSDIVPTSATHILLLFVFLLFGIGTLARILARILRRFAH